MIRRLVAKLWGDLQGDELKKFLYLAAGAFCLIGSYWPLKPLKESIFINMVGSASLRDMKVVSVVAAVLFVLLYTKLVDFFSKQKLVYAFVLFYAFFGGVFFILLSDPVSGVANTVASSDRYLAWAFYLFAESYLTIMVALYWSFINDITTSAVAKKGYAMIIFGSQFGGLVFSFIGDHLMSDPSAYVTRAPLIVAISSAMFLMLGSIVWLLTHTVPAHLLESTSEAPKKKEKVGVLEGLLVFIKQPYVAGIFGLVFFQEVISTLMGLQMATEVETYYLDAGVRTQYFFRYALILQLIACVFALLGTSYVHRRFGTRACLIGFPFGLLLCGIAYLIKPHLHVVTFFMLMIKALHYAMNQPIKESLYIPTTREIKYKAKAWIDMMGLRGSKVVGAQLSKIIGSSPTLVGLAAVAGLTAWVFTASAVGSINERAVRRKDIIG